MELNLMCAICGQRWTVVRWAPRAMSCPKCGSGKLGDARSPIEEQQRLAKRAAARLQKTIEHTAPP